MNIGVIFNEHMSLDKHVTNICKACFFHLRNISKIRDCLSQADTEKLVKVHAFITSKGPGKRRHIVADTLLPMMFLGLRKLGNICVGNNVSATMCPRLPGP